LEPYRFRQKSGEYVHIETIFSVFENPFNNKIEYVIHRTRLVSREQEIRQISSPEKLNYSPLMLTTEEFNMLHSATPGYNNYNSTTDMDYQITNNSRNI
jgi:hypothetical protein